MSSLACPMCRDGILEHREGRLDQSGDSYLPTSALRCPRCEYARFEPALRARWVPAVAPVGDMTVAPKVDATLEEIEAALEALAA